MQIDSSVFIVFFIAIYILYKICIVDYIYFFFKISIELEKILDYLSLTIF